MSALRSPFLAEVGADVVEMAVLVLFCVAATGVPSDFGASIGTADGGVADELIVSSASVRKVTRAPFWVAASSSARFRFQASSFSCRCCFFSSSVKVVGVEGVAGD